MLVCSCHAVDEAEIRRAIDDGAADEQAVGERTTAGVNCGGCLDRICQLLGEADVPGHGHGLARRVAS